MRRILIGLLVSTALIGCKHVRTAGFDRQANTVTTCGGRWAEMEDLHQQALHSCDRAEVIRCGEEIRGYVGSTHGNASTYGGSTTFGSTSVAVPVRGTCCAFDCR
jgi:hypothetical protein